MHFQVVRVEVQNAVDGSQRGVDLALISGLEEKLNLIDQIRPILRKVNFDQVIQYLLVALPEDLFSEVEGNRIEDLELKQREVEAALMFLDLGRFGVNVFVDENDCL